MFEIKEIIPPYRWEIPCDQIDHQHRAVLRFYGRMFEMRRLSDTGVSYSLLLDFSLLAKDTTPSEAVEAMLDGYPDNPVVDYPFKDWNNYHMSLKEYLEWLLMLRHIAANLPPEVVEENRVAVEVY